MFKIKKDDIIPAMSMLGVFFAYMGFLAFTDSTWIEDVLLGLFCIYVVMKIPQKISLPTFNTRKN